MPSFNKCTFIGNLGGDPEMRYTPSGKPVAQFSVAVNRNFKNSEGEWEQATEWVTAIVWGDSGERAAEQLRKGNLVLIEGRQETQSWVDSETGKKAYRTTHVISNWVNLTKREGEGGGRHDTLGYAMEADAGNSPGSGVRTPSTAGVGDDLDDLPF